MINKIIEILKGGGVVALPTDTIYGIVGDPTIESSVNKAYSIKNRARSKKISILLDDVKRIKDIAILTPKIEEFIDTELKNNTIVLKKKDRNYLKLISDDTLGMRVPNSPFIKELIKSYGKPIFATSVNLSGNKECTTYGEIVNNFGDKIDFIVKNDGMVASNKPSHVFIADGDDLIQVR